MRKFDSKIKNSCYFFYRLVEPIVDPIKLFRGVYGYFWFFRDYIKFKKISKSKIKFFDIFPQLHDKTSLTPFDAHYFFQQLWVFENVLKSKPSSHIDIASTYQMSGYLSKIVPTKFVDYRPIETNLKNLEIIKGDITNLPFENNSIESISCLHVLEHIGLGRYGDPISNDGYKKGAKELSRVLSKGGKLFFSVPIGKEKIYFNAHRVFNPNTILKLFDNLKLTSFSYVDDEGKFYQNEDPQDLTGINYGCGMFLFAKEK